MAECPIWIGDPALGMVDIAYEKYSAFASQSFQIAMEGLQALGTFQINGVNTSNSYNASMSLAEYRRPTKPTSAQIDLSLPALPGFNVQDETLREPPVDTSQIPVLSIPPPPSQSLPTAPGNAPPLYRDWETTQRVGILIAEDGSGSMAGEREIWAWLS